MKAAPAATPIPAPRRWGWLAGAALSVGTTLVLGVLSPAGAAAYVRQTVDGDPTIYLWWRSRRITYRVAYDTILDVDQASAALAVRRSFDTWQTQVLADGELCTDLELVFDGSPVGYSSNLYGGGPSGDGQNSIIWRDDSQDATWPAPGSTVSQEALAVTTLIYRKTTGEILDADIDFNAVNFVFTTDDPPGRVITDIQNTLTHEAGHFIGLAHNNTDPDATMYGSADPGETKKRDLSADDNDAVCTIYPYGLDTPDVPGHVAGELRTPPTLIGQGCDVSGGRNGAATLALLILSIWITRVGSRRRDRG